MYHHVKKLMYTVNIESPREAEAHRSTRCRSRVPGDATRGTFSERFNLPYRAALPQHHV